MNDKFQEARERIIDQNSDSQTLLGMPATVKRLMSVMYYYEKPMTLEDMMELLGMSKASMSNAVRELDEIGLVEKVWRKGERKDLYKVEEDNYESFFKFFSYHWRKVINPKTVSMKKSIDELNQLLKSEDIDEETTALIQKDLEKLHDGLAYYDWLNRLIGTFESHEIFDLVPKSPKQQKSGK
ncbi:MULTISPECIES: GbsR/MarR family transcriptional regulator [Planococcus]|uniref:HTH-type transcriptional regulator n=1 Tax=Planococcus maitriensis TaxID=221799 RepID=A0A365K3L1_9BACL|nr:GbsR/MarR family transcriptional regulator [Planococcus maitriensis]RAZ67229.1 GbsR/MarR family transcriptional regulator [Planococcus maitriensis]